MNYTNDVLTIFGIQTRVKCKFPRAGYQKVNYRARDIKK